MSRRVQVLFAQVPFPFDKFVDRVLAVCPASPRVPTMLWYIGTKKIKRMRCQEMGTNWVKFQTAFFATRFSLLTEERSNNS